MVCWYRQLLAIFFFSPRFQLLILRSHDLLSLIFDSLLVNVLFSPAFCQLPSPCLPGYFIHYKIITPSIIYLRFQYSHSINTGYGTEQPTNTCSNALMTAWSRSEVVKSCETNFWATYNNTSQISKRGRHLLYHAIYLFFSPSLLLLEYVNTFIDSSQQILRAIKESYHSSNIRKDGLVKIYPHSDHVDDRCGILPC